MRSISAPRHRHIMRHISSTSVAFKSSCSPPPPPQKGDHGTSRGIQEGAEPAESFSRATKCTDEINEPAADFRQSTPSAGRDLARSTAIRSRQNHTHRQPTGANHQTLLSNRCSPHNSRRTASKLGESTAQNHHVIADLEPAVSS